MPSRRTIVSLLCSLTTAGCVAPSLRRESARLGSIQLENDDDEPAEVTVNVVHQGVALLEETYELPAKTTRPLSESAKNKIPDEGRDVTIKASLTGEERWQTATLVDRYDQSCLDALIRVSVNGKLLIQLSGCDRSS